VAETLGFKRYALAYLSPQATGKNLLIGANFASAASGYDEKAAILNVSVKNNTNTRLRRFTSRLLTL
jgi:hypothetical protein